MTAFGCVGSTIRLRSGIYLDLADPQPESITPEDIAGALSKICRFGGQINAFYSVAEHCCRCAFQAGIDGLPLELCRSVFLHDAAEAFCGDMVKPLKELLPGFSEIELRIERAIEQRFGVDLTGKEAKAAIRKIDWEALIAERKSLFSADDVEWSGEKSVRPLGWKIHPLNPSGAEHEWFVTAERLGIN